MFIAIIGTQLSGKATVANYLRLKGFTAVRIVDSGVPVKEEDAEFLRSDGLRGQSSSSSYISDAGPDRDIDTPFDSVAGLGALNLPSSTAAASLQTAQRGLDQSLSFSSAADLLDHVTKYWRSNFVTIDLRTADVLQLFSKRPFFLLINIDAPVLIRGAHSALRHPSSLNSMQKYVNMHVVNDFDSVPALYAHLDELDITDPDRLRPSWDTYFMTLASLASMRSNCMKRRVGAILVRDKRIVATGYNGTPRGLTNCNEGGCARCNKTASQKEACLCLHAEENALLEAGRERIGGGATLYCNTCPCLTCTVKIVQMGVTEVVYNLSYKVDDLSARIFHEAGVQLRRHAPPLVDTDLS
ncbi:hypothetical protein FA95DRAFT_1607880 [Auriscalpium vulgare]|uniref:Uncharacterized protein n=1 Tax=Auriscalpium vulgare TaxID=40419 RepID=A0ACB8RMK2_9AGAM|nr:hypothetical protein FA95DRAFT_1607880 [Auriscalpium vulgare]